MYEVKRGTKPVAEITVPLNRVSQVTEEARTEGVLFHVVACGTTHACVFLFVHPHLLTVVKHMNGEEDAGNDFITWTWGKVFGYSEEAIAEFISNLKKNDT